MNKFLSFLKIAAVFLTLGLLAGCESSGGSSQVYGSVSYGVGFYDPWYYGGGYGGGAIIVAPPIHGGGNRPTPLPARPRPSPRMR